MLQQLRTLSMTRLVCYIKFFKRGFIIQFLVNSKLKQKDIYSVENLNFDMIEAMAEVLNVEPYHELAHQLDGTKSEFNDVDGEYLGNDTTISEEKRKFQTVLSALQRGIFWETLEEIDKFKMVQEEKGSD